MCRFLMIKSRTVFQPREILKTFSRMVKSSRALDGDWQGDGWGVSWLNGDQEWILQKSIHPIWECESLFRLIPESRYFLIHARSASFSVHKNNLAFNQPFVKGRLGFVFNGLVKGVSLPYRIQGNIGSQKIWNILLELIGKSTPEEALLKIINLLQKHSRFVQALNIGLCNGRNMYAFCHFMRHPEYYNLQHHESDELKMICSESLEGYDFQPVIPGQPVVF